MNATVIVGLALAGAASVALNASYLIQHAGSQSAPEIRVRRPFAALRALLRSPLWLLGLALGLVGWGLHVGALSCAPLSLVQAFAAGGLALTVPAASRWLGVRLLPRERVAVLVMGAALLALGVGDRAGHGHFSAMTLVVLCVAGVALAGTLLPIATGRRTALLGASAGILYGTADAATKALTLAAAGGLGSALGTAWPAAIAALSAGAFLCFQRGLQQGPVVPVIALMTVTTTVSSVLCGLVAFGDPLGAGPAAVTLHLLAFAAIAAGAWVLGGGQARLADGARPAHGGVSGVGLGPAARGSHA